ncbi:hypothetical protein DW083_10840 [Parabacteroides sp. AF48-14]|nr:hypothetical protein DW083_10840 [Parabacteroides sp. AF48-14]
MLSGYFISFNQSTDNSNFAGYGTINYYLGELIVKNVFFKRKKRFESKQMLIRFFDLKKGLFLLF